MKPLRDRRTTPADFFSILLEGGVFVQYWVKIVFVDNQELLVKDAIRHTISDDMEVLEVDSAKEVIIIPMKQIKYLACDATVFATKKPG
ncbi:MAG: hypothetical protein AAB242_01110 [Nitrospirota bacterium]